MKHYFQELASMLGFLLVVCSIVVGALAVIYSYADKHCTEFCVSSGHTPQYKWSLGCYCDDENGNRYSPKLLLPEGATDIKIEVR